MQANIAMLYPQNNAFRQFRDLSGFWQLRFDPEDQGQPAGWGQGFDGGRPVAVPASWNDQFEDGRDFLGPAWYQTRFQLPWSWQGREIYLRFGSVNYLAEVWLNGTRLGEHEGGHLPFEFEISESLQAEDNLLVVRVDGQLAPDRVPPGGRSGQPGDTFITHQSNHPLTYFDFFPFCGIHRPVLLYAVSGEGLKDITVTSTLEDGIGLLQVRLQRQGEQPARACVTLEGHGAFIQKELSLEHHGEAILQVPEPALWAPGQPNRYDVSVVLTQYGEAIDRYDLKTGLRTIELTGNQLLLNGEPIQLRGFGRHEDFPVSGRGYQPAVIVKDYALMDWVGANSFRTTHYPYSEQMLDLADELGFLVIAETPAVGLFFREDGLEQRLALCRQMTSEMIQRDKNHPSVIAWSLANEPQSTWEAAKGFFRELYDLAKELDPSRPATLVSHLGVAEESFEFLDFVCLNRYHGWYTMAGRIEEGVAFFSEELDALYERYGKPVLVSEFGADTIPGWHAQPPEMFSEEYQVEFLRQTIAMLESKPYVIGQHVWNLCDFKTSQGVVRMGGINYKGVFTRDRRPKMAAHFLRQLWRGE
ncbi:MAG: beta-glucuronidase [Anaerolineales bacterium]|nr:beta-glucuronidase [Anaerolineales bacterium]